MRPAAANIVRTNPPCALRISPIPSPPAVPLSGISFAASWCGIRSTAASAPIQTSVPAPTRFCVREPTPRPTSSPESIPEIPERRAPLVPLASRRRAPCSAALPMREGFQVPACACAVRRRARSPRGFVSGISPETRASKGADTAADFSETKCRLESREPPARFSFPRSWQTCENQIRVARRQAVARQLRRRSVKSRLAHGRELQLAAEPCVMRKPVALAKREAGDRPPVIRLAELIVQKFPEIVRLIRFAGNVPDLPARHALIAFIVHAAHANAALHQSAHRQRTQRRNNRFHMRTPRAGLEFNRARIPCRALDEPDLNLAVQAAFFAGLIYLSPYSSQHSISLATASAAESPAS